MKDTKLFPIGSELVAYLRDSGGVEQDLSLEQQLLEIQDWVNSNGYTLIKVFKDEARTGTSIVGRDGFLEMIQYFRAKGCSARGLVLWKYSRFARDIDDAQFYRADLRRRGFIVHSIKDQIPAGPAGRFMEAAIDWANQRYIEDLRTDVRRGLLNLVTQHKCMSGPAPFGYKRDPVIIGTRRDGRPHIAHRWIPDPETAPLVQRAFEMRAAGCTYNQIREELGIYKDISGYGYMFRNTIYLGILDYNGVIVEDFTEPIVDRKIWDQIQQINRGWEKCRPRWAEKNHPRRRGSSFLFSGLVRCGICGQLFVGYNAHSNGKVYQYYRCGSGRRRAHTGFMYAHKPKTSIPRAELEGKILDLFQARFSLPDFNQSIYKQVEKYMKENFERDSQLKNHLEDQGEQLEQEINRMLDAIAAHGHSPALLDRLGKLEEQYKKNRLELAGLRQNTNSFEFPTLDEVVEYVNQIRDNLQASHQDELKRTLRSLVKEIIVKQLPTGDIFFDIELIFPFRESDPDDLGLQSKTPHIVPHKKQILSHHLHSPLWHFPLEKKLLLLAK